MANRLHCRRYPALPMLVAALDGHPWFDGGLEVQTTLRRKNTKLDPAVCGERLAQVLALADALPKRPAAAQGDKAQYRIEP